MAKTATDAVRGAFDRARGRRALVHFLTTNAGGFATYVVGSTADVDTAYTVTVDQAGQFRCTCAAADRGCPACWHRAAVYQLRANRVAWGLPADGPSAGQFRTAAVRNSSPGEELASRPGTETARREHARERLAEVAALFAA